MCSLAALVQATSFVFPLIHVLTNVYREQERTTTYMYPECLRNQWRPVDSFSSWQVLSFTPCGITPVRCEFSQLKSILSIFFP
ncbi:hypothetical protein B0H19DRAFT_1110819 [Mycena capillaripes]|nr:hypothetical protein B0H19DRAFT_1110819 [Mycena capillaripes]